MYVHGCNNNVINSFLRFCVVRPRADSIQIIWCRKLIFVDEKSGFRNNVSLNNPFGFENEWKMLNGVNNTNLRTKMAKSRPNMINPYCKQKRRRLLFELERQNPCINHKNSKLRRLLSQNQQQCIHPTVSRHTLPSMPNSCDRWIKINKFSIPSKSVQGSERRVPAKSGVYWYFKSANNKACEKGKQMGAFYAKRNVERVHKFQCIM